MSDTKYLTKRRQGYYVEIEVPPSLRPTLGKKRLVKSLQTRDLQIARAKRWAAVAELKATIEKARVGGTASSLEQEALALREAVGRVWSHEESEGLSYHIRGRTDELLGYPVGEDAFGEPTFDESREREALRFNKLATGRATPVLLNLADWLAASGLPTRTQSLNRRTVRTLSEWLSQSGRPDEIEAISREVAQRFLVEHLIREKGLSRSTVASYRWGVTDYWRWLRDVGRAPQLSNVWENQRLPRPETMAAKVAQGRHETERPFTDEELGRLLGGSPSERDRDAILFGALTGARIEAIFRLRVRDCDLVERTLHMPPLKRERGGRLLPIHPDLLETVKRRCTGKDDAEWLFEGAEGAGNEGRERSMAASKAFGRYLRRLKLEQMRPGVRRSLINYHSFRRWFVTKAEEAGFSESLIALAVGHKRAGVTLGVYSKPDMLKQLRDLVGSIQLPPPIEPDTKLPEP